MIADLLAIIVYIRMGILNFKVFCLYGSHMTRPDAMLCSSLHIKAHDVIMHAK